MATIDSNPKQTLSYAFSYGLFCGPRHSKQLTSMLNQAGLRLASNSTQADIIIAHSAGCWFNPAPRPKLVIYIGPALGQPIFITWLRANKYNIVSFIHEHLIKNGARIYSSNFMYGFLQPLRSLKIILMARHAACNPPQKSSVLVIVNRYDPWPQSAALNTYVDQKPWTFIALPGSHDNIWANPKLYVELITIYAQQLLV